MFYLSCLINEIRFLSTKSENHWQAEKRSGGGGVPLRATGLLLEPSASFPALLRAHVGLSQWPLTSEQGGGLCTLAHLAWGCRTGWAEGELGVSLLAGWLLLPQTFRPFMTSWLLASGKVSLLPQGQALLSEARELQSRLHSPGTGVLKDFRLHSLDSEYEF